MKKERLFRLLKEKDKGIVQIIKQDKELIEISNSYCKQCGECCKSLCKNKEIKDGLTYCLLHDSSGNYPNGKKISEYPRDICDRLDPRIWAKPSVCHTYGPYSVLLAIVGYEKEGEWKLAEITKEKCKGAEKMFEDYKEFFIRNQ